MRIPEERFIKNGKEFILRNAQPEDAQMLIDYLKTVTGETRYLMKDPDEVTLTLEQETAFIKRYHDAKDGLLILAFVDGEYIGNCSFDSKAGSRRAAHRAGIGIALFQKYTGQGYGRIMLEKLIEKARERGFEQLELTVVGGNQRAYHLYESLGFRECGRIPDANKYADGTYADDIFMSVKI